MKQIGYTWNQFNGDVVLLQHIILNSGFKPNYILGISRGGACLATALSYRLKVPVKYIDFKDLRNMDVINSRDKFLVVDDINDTGNTLNSIRKLIIKTLHPEFTGDGDKIFELNNIKYATIFNNPKSEFSGNFYVRALEEKDIPFWVTFPWEEIFIDE